MNSELRRVIGGIPYRAALAGGWIDQPFISCLNPTPPGSMVVVGLEPDFYWMDRCGMGTSTRKVALRLWGSEIPPVNDRANNSAVGTGSTAQVDSASLVRQLYAAENHGKTEPSGSQDMAGIIYPGINRLDYDAEVHGGYFPAHVESNCDREVAAWLEQVLHVLPVNQRPAGYSPLGIKNLDLEWVRRLGQSGKDCFAAIAGMDALRLGASFNECMLCWEMLLPQTVRHPALTLDLVELMRSYQSRYCGAMFSGCGGGYLYVISTEPVPGAFKVRVRLAGQKEE